jgi:hypothetical protein
MKHYTLMPRPNPKSKIAPIGKKKYVRKGLKMNTRGQWRKTAKSSPHKQLVSLLGKKSIPINVMVDQY